MGPERKLYKKLKSKTPKIIWNRLEHMIGEELYAQVKADDMNNKSFENITQI